MTRDAGWLQAPLFAPALQWTPTPVAQMPTWRDGKRVAVDIECRDDDLSALGPGPRRGGYMCGVSFAIEDGPAHYLPFRHEGGGNLDETAVKNYLRDQAKEFTGTIVLNGGQYDLDYLWDDGIEFKCAAWHRDIQVAEPLLDELQDTYNLNDIAARRGLPGKDEGELRAHADAWGVDAKKGLWRLHSGAVGAYAIRDCTLPLALLRRQEREIEEQELQRVYDLESKVTLALLRMTRRGLMVDLPELDRVEIWAKQRLQDYLDIIHHLTGVRVTSISNARQLAPALVARGLTVPTGGEHGQLSATLCSCGKSFKIPATLAKHVADPPPSITKLWLAAQNDEVAKAIVSGREFQKLLTTYVAGFRKHMVGDRIHPSFKQLHGASDDEDEDDEGARFGRCASRHPNIQAQMKRSKEIQKRWRRVLCAPAGQKRYKGDYSQQEPRTTVHYAEICNLPKAAQAAQAYRDNPRQDSYDLMVELCQLPRDDVKELYLGRCYGMGGGKLADKLKLPTEWRVNKRDGKTYKAAGPEAQAILDRFDREIPYVKLLARRCEDTAKMRGYLITDGGRRCRFPKDSSGNYDWTYKALNRLIQGRAADQTKTAAVMLDEAGYPLDLTVHDEFGFCGDDDRYAIGMADIMKEALPLRVPSRVDIEAGPNYGEMKLLEIAA